MKTIRYKLGESVLGAYDISKDSDEIVKLQSGRVFHLQDHWCGNGVEGKTYRPFFEEISRKEAAQKIRAARKSLDVFYCEEPSENIRRLSRGPIWLRKAIKNASFKTIGRIA